MPVTLTKLNCANCGAPLDWDGTYGQPITCPYCGSTFMPGPTEVDDVWLFTDPVARARGKLIVLSSQPVAQSASAGNMHNSPAWRSCIPGCFSQAKGRGQPTPTALPG